LFSGQFNLVKFEGKGGKEMSWLKSQYNSAKFCGKGGKELS
jgi:hypothetical protein